MLRSIKTSITTRIRRLWTQCDLFDALPPEGTVVAPPSKGPKRGRKRSRVRITHTHTSTHVHVTRTHVKQRVPRTHPQDVPFVTRLNEAYHQYNARLFHGELTPVMIRVSRRMKNRLGHYMVATRSGLPAEIAISLRHIRRDPWDEVLHTLVHEMVHQWQDQHGFPIDHGARFRAKAREVGISARATRRVA